MKILSRRPVKLYGTLVILLSAFFIGAGVVFVAGQVSAESTIEPTPGERLITLHDDGQDKGILTKATTLKDALKEANILIDPNDIIEPGLDEKLIASTYDVNIYRARPVTVVDGAIRQKVMSPYQTAKQIAEHAGISLHDEDITTLEANTDMVSEGAGIQLNIDRAIEFTFNFYGTKATTYTQSKTVSEMLKQKGITIGENDTLSVPLDTSMTPGMVIELWRNGKQTAVGEEDVAFDTEKIQDADRPIGYRAIKTPGVVGKKKVTYEIEMKNGQEVRRTAIQSVITKEPVKAVEVVGAKAGFGGDFAEALAKLRSCEGGYNSWNPAGPYYGAYQFNEGTWNSVSSAPFGNATPAEQDAAARALYLRRGWQPWPSCSQKMGLQDIYR
ncbi:MAG TPA: ubiquitin-like domain-containing protein [Candidatus Saccharimonadales bacterium]|nr:ubiquitin-like domain-containing protein [Candidatus Saccharimonadales bacterium]